MQRILTLSTQQGDLVLDSFAGSGTTGAVAHKMGRRWIMVELGENIHTHIIPRLKKVIDGADKGGITNAVNWQGGGGFRYERLAPSLLERDKWGNWVIRKEYNAAMLAEALCKLEGFAYAPSDSVYWQHGHSTERDFIYITTQNLSHAQLQQLSDEVGAERSLLVLCPAFRAKPDVFPNLTVKKIPKAVLNRAEWGHDDYSLRVENLPQAPLKEGEQLTLPDVTGFRKPVTSVTSVTSILELIRAEFPTVTDFEREFPSVCFALATGVGKTRLMGAFISYLYLARGLNNFFVLAPNLTIYNKLITDFTPNTPKYVFKGIAEFATNPPALITGDNYEMAADTLFDVLLRCKINIFNISKINSEMRGGKMPRIKRLSEYIGQSYFDYLAGLQDLVILMDESHRYRASAGVRAINELKPVLGLELTATPFVETSKGAVAFKNVIVDYPLGRAMADGFVKEPAVVTRKNFSPAGLSPEQLEQMKLEDGVRLHENVKVELETYARENAQPIVKPFLLVIARETTHAGQLLKWIQSDEFFQGRYKDKVIQVDSSKTGAEEDEMVERLLKVEQNDEPTEIVIHVNMLKEGWDVTNLYTIVPLRAANARILIEQSIGRGLRLPYGKRTGVTAVDRLNIIAHDKFQEIVDEASRADSAIRLQQVILPADGVPEKSVTVVSAPVIEIMLTNVTGFQKPVTFVQEPVTSEEKQVAKIAYAVIRKYENQPDQVPSVTYLKKPEIQAAITREVQAQYHPIQMEMAGVAPPVNIAAVVAQTTALVQQKTIDIPRIVVVPKTKVRSGFHPFTLQLDALQFAPPSDELVIQTLRTQEREIVGIGKGGMQEKRLEDYIVRGLVDFDDIAYDAHADLLYDLAAQTIQHFRSYLDEDDTRKVLIVYQKQIADFIHAQMQAHYWEDAAEYEAKITKGFDSLKTSAFTQTDAALDFRQAPADKSNMAKYLFMGFTRCLYPYQKFQSDAERRLAVILDHESEKWFKPAKGQFQLFYKWGSDHLEYQPDFVAETTDAIYMLETKAANEMTDAQVLAKRDAAVQWCEHASAHSANHSGKPWQYALIPHDAIAGNMTLDWLVKQYGVKSAT